ncbi:hypothetical protein [Streptomyces sp. NPDC048111]|uniref:COG1470 family protein n=1 Tax=Streptomyces sp. NPDC048111 TaxID=3365500 RepID=UPI003710F565
MRPIRLALPALVLLLCALPAPAAQAAPARGGEWTAAPASGSGSAGARPCFYLEGAPGAVLQDTLALSNPSDAPLTLTLRAAAARNAADGNIAADDSPDPWIALAASEVRIPPHTRADVPFAVTVPPGAGPGDHPAALVATAAGRTQATRVQLRVSGPALSALTVEAVRVDTARGLIRYALVNRGSTTLAPRLALHADGVFGRALDRPAKALPVELLPGQRVELSEPWAHPPALDRVAVRLDVTAGGGARATARADAVFVSRGAVATAAPVLLGAAAGALHIVRRRRGRGSGPGWTARRRRGRAAAADEPAVPEPELAQTGAVQ